MKQKKNQAALSEQEQMLGAYKSKLKREAFLKSLLAALTIGFLLSALVSVISFATARDILWIALVVWGVATAGLTVTFYFTVYRTDIKQTAARVDEIGLEERVITMVQYRDSDSAMLKRQREDAQEALQTVSAGQIKTRVSRILVILLAVLACLSIFMMSYSTVLAGRAKELSEKPPVEEELSEEDKIIQQMIDELRKTIDEAEVSAELKTTLHGLVDDLEASLRPEDSLEVKVAKIVETADEIHRLIEEYLNRSTIAEELQKYDTTYELGKAIGSQDATQIKDAFQMMYGRIEPLVQQAKYEEIYQTAMDIDQALKDARNTPPALQKALEDLRDAYLRVLPPMLEDGTFDDSEYEMTDEEIDEAIKDALQDAMEAIQDFFGNEDLDEIQDQLDENTGNLDDALQDVIQDAMDKLGQEFEFPEEPEEPEDPEGQLPEGQLPEGQLPEDEENPGQNAPDGDSSKYDSVIDGETSYKDVFDQDGYSDEMKDKLESGELSDEDREVLQDYLDTLE